MLLQIEGLIVEVVDEQLALLDSLNANQLHGVEPIAAIKQECFGQQVFVVPW